MGQKHESQSIFGWILKLVELFRETGQIYQKILFESAFPDFNISFTLICRSSMVRSWVHDGLLRGWEGIGCMAMSFSTLYVMEPLLEIGRAFVHGEGTDLAAD